MITDEAVGGSMTAKNHYISFGYDPLGAGLKLLA